ncbi:MAG: hypothetical protein PHD72_00635 [Patescibacteria group bacterium]|nr:hypothetical protein [Patescibacteria group bacterium]
MEKEKCGIEFYLVRWQGEFGEYELFIRHQQPGEGGIAAFFGPRDLRPLRVVTSGVIQFEGEEQKIAESIANILTAPLLSKFINTVVNRIFTQALSTKKE